MGAGTVTVAVKVAGEVKHFAEMPEDDAFDYVDRIFTLYDEDQDVSVTVVGMWLP